MCTIAASPGSFYGFPTVEAIEERIKELTPVIIDLEEKIKICTSKIKEMQVSLLDLKHKQTSVQDSYNKAKTHYETEKNSLFGRIVLFIASYNNRICRYLLTIPPIAKKMLCIAEAKTDFDNKETTLSRLNLSIFEYESEIRAHQDVKKGHENLLKAYRSSKARKEVSLTIFEIFGGQEGVNQLPELDISQLESQAGFSPTHLPSSKISEPLMRGQNSQKHPFITLKRGECVQIIYYDREESKWYTPWYGRLFYFAAGRSPNPKGAEISSRSSLTYLKDVVFPIKSHSIS